MKSGLRLRFMGATLAVAGLAVTGITFSSPRGRADDQGDNSDSRIEKGFEIAPVHLNLEGKNRALVGLGSYIVNAQADCDGCHSAGPPTEFARGGNPYMGQPEKVNPATYLGGGRVFPPLLPCNPPAVPCSAAFISRNLTPSTKTGLPEGDHTFEEFLEILRTGKDFDHLHPTCPMGTVNAGCVPAPFNGDLLQIMPWPIQKNMSDHDIRAIYEYLSAIPCVHGNYPGEPADRCQ